MAEITASLVYDSWIDRVPELRSVPEPDRHLIFEGDGLILDLLVKKPGDGGCIHIGGQILPGDNALDTVSGVEVLIKQGTRRTYTSTNALGEFAFHATPDRELDLTIALGDRRFVVRGLSNRQPHAWRILPLR